MQKISWIYFTEEDPRTPSSVIFAAHTFENLTFREHTWISQYSGGNKENTVDCIYGKCTYFALLNVLKMSLKISSWKKWEPCNLINPSAPEFNLSVGHRATQLK